MKHRPNRFRAFALFWVTVTGWGLLAGPAVARGAATLTCARIPELTRTFLHKHISFHYLNDELRGRVIDTYVKHIDPSKSFYLMAEVEELKTRFKKNILQDIREGNCSALNDIQKDLIRRYARTEEFVRQLVESETYEIDEDSILIIDSDKRSHPRTNESREDLVTRLVHFQMSNYVSGDMELTEAKKKLVHRYELMTKHTKERTEAEIYSTYLDAFASALDPHSNYVSRDALEDFKIQMGLSLEGIGVALSSRDGYSVVEKVIPGGAADSLGVIEPKDKIIAVAEDGKEPVDIIDMDLRDVVRKIRGKRGTKVHLTILRQGEENERFRITIVRDKINLEEQAANLRFETVDIDGKSTKLAVLELPSFYGGSNPGERQSSRDVEKLLKEADKAGAKGLVLDLSRNGGGLLPNSVDIAGFFIREGGVVAVKDTFSKVEVLRDRDAKIVYDGPMVVLTSRVSASASEIVAGAMKDYRRAIIVGDDHTFGKGTVQSMVQLPEGLGALKVTTALFFRPGGKSTQHEGVAADIIVPSIFGTDDFGEMHQTYSLPIQSIPPFIDASDRPSLTDSNLRAPWQGVTPKLVEELSRLSAVRVAENEDLAKVRERVAKAEKRNGVVHLRDLIDEKEEEENARNDASTDEEKKKAEEASNDAEGDDILDLSDPPASDLESDSEEHPPSPQQLEAVQILADLIRLTS
jgi:carboxyl-terminal processing protease